jgi:two-component system response regulator AtoC
MPGVELQILIAEDEPHQRAFMERVCREGGHRVEAVADGRSCLDALGHRRFDLLFLDLFMPELDGVGVLREMREREGRVWPRVVVISSQDDESVIEETLRLGASVYLTKPMAAQTVQKVLDQMVLRATLAGVQAPPPLNPPG